MEKKISTSEVLGELRRMSRLYKVFEKATEAAETLLDHEKQVSSLQKEVTSLNGIKADLETECTETVLRLDESKAKADKIGGEINHRLTEEKAKTDKIRADALDEAKQIISRAEGEAEVILAKIKTLKTEESTAKTLRDKAVGDLESVKRDIESTRKRFANSLG